MKDTVAELAESAKGELAQDWESAKEGARDAAENVRTLARQAENTVERAGGAVLRTLKENPLPFALTGAGLAWLAINLRAHPSTKPTQQAGEGNGSSTALGSAVGQVKQKARSAVEQVEQTAGEIASEAGDITKQATNKMRQVSREVSKSTRAIVRGVGERGQAVERTIAKTLRENPTMVGAAAIAVGAVAGLVLPRTRMEDEWVGARRDQVVQKAQEAAKETVAKAETAAKKLVGVTREARNIVTGDGERES